MCNTNHLLIDMLLSDARLPVAHQALVESVITCSTTTMYPQMESTLATMHRGTHVEDDQK